jgi:hypothetical protein
VQRQPEEEEEETAVQPAPETAMRAPEPPALPLAVQRQAEEEEEEETIQAAPETAMRAPEPPALPLAVQRQAEEEEEEETIQAAPETAMRAPEPPALPLAVQRQAEEEEEEETIQTAPETAMRAPEPPALPLAVQRQEEEEEEETEVQPAPETAMRAPEPPALPLAVQRQPEEEEEEEPIQTAPQAVIRAPEIPALPLAVQRQAEEEEGEESIQTAPQAVMRAEEKDTSAPDGTLLARAASRTQLPLIKRQEARTRPGGYGALSRSMPVQRTAILPQARFEEPSAQITRDRQPLPVPSAARTTVQRREATERATIPEMGRSQVWERELPLPPAITVQRQTIAVSPVPTTVQRDLEEPAEVTAPAVEGEKTALDLDRLARQILPLLKRMLSVERERRVGRW